ncbi:LPS export ABC transporter periplasmic protein LptC [Marinomonas aquiplantarum]|uniref:Lipopolysaccharide export system protein LptC n=1 Tax=Marinomonas aquiplantarum TaxID=491951 RepID=A0A366CXI9_9GAMM|nr:LPS export ABC transporter periplasmic protein LptC [Marinomonas aquiplantarum]RBO82552.1 lipopolysaccharide export system protein LptC [Marinomonas aquiplantarum]
MSSQHSNKSFRIVVLMAAFAVIALALFWYQAAPKVNLLSTDSLSSTPDYFITEVTAQRFDPQGKLIETIHAEQTLHYIQAAKTLLEQPNVDRYSTSGSWHAEARQGAIEDGSNDILLTDNVTAVKKYQGSEDVLLNADTIHYLDQDKSLTSQGNATLTSNQGKTSAGTITTYINSEEVIMTGSVRGNYETIH